MTNAYFLPIALAILFVAENAAFAAEPGGGWVSDNGDGTYKNPITWADYSDPDVIRVGEDFYMVASSFHYMPGIPVLHSKDLVNWEIISHVYERMDDPAYDMKGGQNRYGRGAWAPSIRFHDGKFFVYCCTVTEGCFMSTATNPAGPWAPLTWVMRIEPGKGKAWEDPCPIWEPDGSAYLVHSLIGGGPLILHKLSPDGKTLLDDGKTIFEKNLKYGSLEGPKFYKRNGYYYIFCPAGGVEMGFQVAMRSKDIYGPYEVRTVLEKGSTRINGPHQGGYVELDNGEGWFIHFQQVGAFGRFPHLQPVQWVEDWPIIGKQVPGKPVGEPVAGGKKPGVGKTYPILPPQTSDEFDGAKLALQWQWNHNPVDANWSLTARTGFLRLTAMKAGDLHGARNVLTQKLVSPAADYTTVLDVAGMKDGQIAGLCILGEPFGWVGVMQAGGKKQVRMYWTNDWRKGNQTVDGEELAGNTVFLRMCVEPGRSGDSGERASFSYSLDGKEFKQLGDPLKLYFSWWTGMKPGVFTYTRGEEGGDADFDWFRYDGR